jgi:hypothetical protein
VRIFSAILSSFFSAAKQLRVFIPHLITLASVPAFVGLWSLFSIVLNTSSPSGSAGFPRRTIYEGQILNGAQDRPEVFWLKG